MCMTHGEAKQYQNVRVCSREKFIEGPAMLWVGHALKIPNSLKGFSKAFFEARWSGRAVGSVWEQFSDWLIGYRASDVTVNIILSASRSGDYMLRVIKWLMSSIGWWLWHLKNNSGDVYQIQLSRYIREKLKQKIRGRGLSREGLIGSCSITQTHRTMAPRVNPRVNHELWVLWCVNVRDFFFLGGGKK